ncbi:CBS domain-containing protein [Candidatus Woesearchaeota archaeon]|nr:CBS domain-containing protein [Candidatus Woesearchaeota archaeon]MBW3021740.1 CBS domain-containing protein [Candidatus Woesearchaeota archaeon]
MKIKDCVLIEPFKCTEEESIVEVAKKIRSKTLNHIFVVNEKDYPIGIISVTDMNNRVCAEGKDPNSLKAKDIMSQPIEVRTLDDDVEAVAKEMVSNNRVMNAVAKDGKMIGIVTLHQVLKHRVVQ